MSTLTGTFLKDYDARRCVRCMYALDIPAEKISVRGVSSSAMRAATGRLLSVSAQDKYILRYGVASTIAGVVIALLAWKLDASFGLMVRMGLMRCAMLGAVLGCMFGTLVGCLLGSGSSESPGKIEETKLEENQLTIGVQLENESDEQALKAIMEYCGATEMRVGP